MPDTEKLNAGAKPRFLLIVVALVAIAAAGVPLVEKLAADRELLKPYDFVQYWSAGRQLLDGRNPYDPDELYPIQRSMYDIRKTVMMWNPPWTLPLTLPFAALPWRLAQLLWFGMQLLAVLLSADLLWRTYGGCERYRWVSWLVALTFAPTLFLLLLGQMAGLLLLGLAGFLHFVRKDRAALAGCCAVLTASKPHLLPLFALALMLEAMQRPSARKASAFGGGLLVALALLPLLWNSHVWTQYFEAMQRPPSETLETMQQFEHPTLGYELRMLVPGEPFAAQFFPALAALPLFVIYWLIRWRSWQWEREMPLIVMASVITAAYGAWAFDMVILLLPVVQTSALLLMSGSKRLIGVVGTAYLTCNILLLRTLPNTGSQANPWISLIVLVGWIGLNRYVARATEGKPKKKLKALSGDCS